MFARFGNTVIKQAAVQSMRNLIYLALLTHLCTYYRLEEIYDVMSGISSIPQRGRPGGWGEAGGKLSHTLCNGAMEKYGKKI